MLSLVNYGRMWLRTVLKDERGQGMVEYGLIIAAIAIVALIGFQAFGGQFKTFMSGLSDKLTTD